MRPRVLILRAPGTNCDLETTFAFEQAGARAEPVHINRLLENPALASQFQIVCIPGGFSYGDDVAAGRILASQIQHHLAGRLEEFRARGGLILGICNGFQVLIKSGILLQPDAQGPPATLTWNDSGKYEDRWVRLAVRGSKSVFLRSINSMYLPVAHAEGKFVPRDEATLVRLDRAGQLVLQYCHRAGGDEATMGYPENPNGSVLNTAGVCDTTGRVLGLMPHPERHIDATQHPRWTRGEGRQPGNGLKLFASAVEYFA